MAAARVSSDPRDRLVVELLARTGMRAGELADLEAGAVVQIGAGHWLRIPLGKLRNDRYVPLTPNWCNCSPPGPQPAWSTSAATSAWSPITAAPRPVCHRPHRRPRRPCRRHPRGAPAPAAAHAGHPGDQPRHAAGGHRRPARPPQDGDDLIYARIANRVVADEYAAVSAKIDALYGQPPELPAGYETTGMARLRREVHARMLGNGLCTRPAELDCRMESACETCAYFRTSTEFLPILTRQRDHARDHGQTERAALFINLIKRIHTQGQTP
jgi:hypothetical protein